MESKDFKITVIKGKNSADVLEPQVATKPDANGQKGEYYHVSVSSGLTMKNGFNKPTQGRRIAFTIFKNGTRSLIFNLIYNALGDKENYTELPDGNIEIKPSSLAFGGNYMAKKVDFHYYLVGTDGKNLIDQATKLPRQDNVVRSFIFDFEDESGLTDIILAGEERRAARRAVSTPEGSVATTVQEEEEDPNVAAAEAARNARRG